MLDWDQPGEEVPMIMLWHKEKWCSQMLKDFMILAENTMGQESMGGSKYLKNDRVKFRRKKN